MEVTIDSTIVSCPSAAKLGPMRADDHVRAGASTMNGVQYAKKVQASASIARSRSTASRHAWSRQGLGQAAPHCTA